MKLVEPDTITLELTNQERKDIIVALEELATENELRDVLDTLWDTLVNGTTKGKKR